MKEEYQCRECGKVEVGTSATIPECCGHSMATKKQLELEGCVQPQNPEAQRLNNDDDACDDGRAAE